MLCFFKSIINHKISYFWHSKYKIVSGKFDKRFFPEIFYNADLKLLLNNPKYIDALSNKFLLSLVIGGSNIGVKTPINIISCNDGILLDQNNKRISTDEAFRILKEYRAVLVKKSVNTYGGKDILVLNELTDKDISFILNDYGDNYLIQAIIRNQDDIKALNPTSLNTFRIITYFVNGKFYASPIILRVGRNNSSIDNAHAGGMFVGVDDDGFIISDAKTVSGESFEKHPDSGIVFKKYKIKNVNVIKEKAVQLATLLPQLKLIDWDLALDENGDVVCIEANIDSGSIWLIQMAHGTPVFAEQTEDMLKLVKNDLSIFGALFRNIKKPRV